MAGDAAPVEVQNAEPIPVVVEKPSATSAQVNADILRTEDQRRISGIWERTQQVAALLIIVVTLIDVSILIVAVLGLAMFGYPVPDFAITASVAGLLSLTSMTNLVIGFYFGRTNHSRVGGVDGSRDV